MRSRGVALWITAAAACSAGNGPLTPPDASVFGRADAARPDVGLAPPGLLRDPEDIGFGRLGLGRVAMLTVVLSPAPVPRSVEVAGCEPDGGGFCGTPSSSAVAAGAEARVVLAFSPRRLGLYEGVLRVQAEGEAPRPIAIRGLAVTTALRCTEQLPALGRVTPGTCVRATVACNNDGLGTAAIERVDVRLPSRSGTARVLSGARRELGPLEGASIEVDLCPSAPGPFLAELVVEPHAPVLLRGLAVGARLASIEAVRLGALPSLVPRLVELPLHNEGTVPLTVHSVSATGSDVVIDPLAPLTLAPGARQALPLVVVPSGRSGAERVLVRLDTDDERGAPIDVPLEYTASDRACRLTLPTTDVRFGMRMLWDHGRAVLPLVLENASTTACPVAIPSDLGARFEHAWRPDDVVDDGRWLHFELAPREIRSWPIALRGAVEGPADQPLELFSGSGAVRTRLLGVVERFVPGLQAESVSAPTCTDASTRDLTQTIRLHPLGAVQLERVRFTPLSAAFVRTRLPPTPVRAQSDAPPELQFVLGGLDGRPHVGRVDVDYDAEGVSRSLSLTVGSAFPGAEVIDRFQLPHAPAVDLVWVIDASGSMEDDRTLQRNVRAHVENLMAQGAHLRFAVVAIDGASTSTHAPISVDEPGAPLFLDAQAMPRAELERRLLARIEATRGVGHQLEQPFEATRLALAHLRQLGQLREGALASVMVLADEDDQSTMEMEELPARLRAAAGLQERGRLELSVVAGGEQGCVGANGRAAPTPRLVRAAALLHGFVASVCDETWWDRFEFVTTSPGSLRFELSNPPAVDTIRVALDGVDTPQVSPGGSSIWAYDLGTRALRLLSPEAVRPGRRIEVRYRVCP